jgi:hypothetical protein
MGFFGTTKKKQVRDNGRTIKTNTYIDGRLKEVKHTDKRTGESHHHNVGHGLFGPFTGKRIK